MNILKTREELLLGKTIYEMPLKVAYYSRVSTDKDEQLNSLENQKNYFEDFIKSNKHWQYIGGYIDEGISGTAVKNRENFLRMINDASKGKIDLILTKEVSRFARNTIDSIKYTEFLLKNGVIVLFISDNINTIYPDSELRLTIMASMAQDEIRRLSERVKFGINMSIKKGTILGNNKLYGYKKYKNKLTIIKKESNIIKQIYSLYGIENKSINYISNYLNNQNIKTSYGKKWSPTTILRILKNPKYKGYYCGNKTETIDYMTKKIIMLPESNWIQYKSNNIPPIIDEVLWNKVNNKLSKKNKTNHNNKYLYTSKLYCTHHNQSLHRRIQLKTSNDISWICSYHLNNKNNKCNINIRESELNIIMNYIINSIIDINLLNKILSKYYQYNIDLSNINITSLILNKMCITNKLSTIHLDIYLNIDNELLNLIKTKELIFNRGDKYTKKYNIKYIIKCYNKKV